MSEYLNRLKQRRDATPPPGNAPNVQSNVTFRKAIDYIEDLEHKIVLAENQERYLLARLKEADEKLKVQDANAASIVNACNNRITELEQEILTLDLKRPVIIKPIDEQREADRINIDNIIKEYRIKCNGENILVKSNVIRRLVSKYYEATQ